MLYPTRRTRLKFGVHLSPFGDPTSEATFAEALGFDLVAIDRDVLSVPPDQLKDVQVLQTWVGGERVYDKH